MNYIKQLNAFFDWLQRNSLSSSAQLLYYTLLVVNNSCGWIESFGRTNQSLSAIMGVSVNTLLKARNELQQKDLISFKKGRKSDVTKYSITKLYEVCSSKYEPQTEPQTEHVLNNKLKLKKDNKHFPPESVEMSLAAELKQRILQNNSNAKTPKNLNGWAQEFDKMLRLDKRAVEEIRMVLVFSQGNSFWMSNILSASKLREKYDTLLLQSKNQKTGQAPQARAPAKGQALTPEQQKKKEFIKSLYI